MSVNWAAALTAWAVTGSMSVCLRRHATAKENITLPFIIGLLQKSSTNKDKTNSKNTNNKEETELRDPRITPQETMLRGRGKIIKTGLRINLWETTQAGHKDPANTC